MKRLLIGLTAATLFGVGPASAQTSDRLRAAVTCKPTGAALTYDCSIDLKRGEKPVEAAAFMVGADMPSMPMAHNVKPVVATPTATPGLYTARLVLEMHGDWAVSLAIDKPARDKIVQVLNFTSSDVTVANRQQRPAGHHGKHHHH
jgi:hypothetical protein